MVYYSPHMKIDYDHLIFEEIDEITVMQQNIHVNINLDEFKFNSRRHLD